jgi:hypothetical protein
MFRRLNDLIDFKQSLQPHLTGSTLLTEQDNIITGIKQ